MNSSISVGDKLQLVLKLCNEDRWYVVGVERNVMHCPVLKK
jgi:hypothetical protein